MSKRPVKEMKGSSPESSPPAKRPKVTAGDAPSTRSGPLHLRSEEESEDELDIINGWKSPVRTVLAAQGSRRTSHVKARKNQEKVDEDAYVDESDEDDDQEDDQQSTESDEENYVDKKDLSSDHSSEEMGTRSLSEGEKAKLGINEGAVASHFSKLNIHYHVERVVKSGPKAKQIAYHTASSVTQDILKQYGGWRFTTSDGWPRNPSSVTWEEIYKALPRSAGGIDPMLPPCEYDTNGNFIKGSKKPHSLIERAMRRMKQNIESEVILSISSEWWVSQFSLKSRFLVLKALNLLNPKRDVKDGFGQRPELPTRFAACLDEFNRNKRSRQEIVPASPDSTVTGTHPSRDSSPDDLSLPTFPEEDDPVTPKTSHRELPATPQKNKAEMKSYINSVDSPSSVPPFPAIHSFIDSIGERLVSDLNIKTIDAENSERLRSALLPLQREWDLKESKRKLCLLVGTPDARQSENPMEKSNEDRPYRFVQYKSREEITELDLSTRCGNTVLNEGAGRLAFTEMEIIRKWLEYDGEDTFGDESTRSAKASPGRKKKSLKDSKDKRSSGNLSEGAVERLVGGLFQAIFHSKEVVTTENASMPILESLRFLGTNPSPDFGLQPCTDEWRVNDWTSLKQLIAPCVFSAECKRTDTISANCEAQLAMNSHATLNIFMMMYLDTRTEQFQKLPGWMCLYSLLYTQEGFTIYAHFPTIQEAKEEGEGWSWRPVSCELSRQFTDVLDIRNRNITIRTQAIRVLLRLRSHAMFLITQIKQWFEASGDFKLGQGILNPLIASAHLQTKDIDWLLEKLDEMK